VEIVENTSSQGYWSRDEIDEIFGWDTTIGEKTEKGWHARMCYAGRNDLDSRTSLCLSDTSTGVSWFRGPYDTLTYRQVCLRTSHNGNSRKFVRRRQRLPEVIPEGGYAQGDPPLVGKGCDYYSGFIPSALVYFQGCDLLSSVGHPSLQAREPERILVSKPIFALPKRTATTPEAAALVR